MSEPLAIRAVQLESQWKPYPDYKDSGIEWLGEIPAHWEVKRLKMAVDLINDKVEGIIDNLKYIGLENIESQTGRMIESESDTVSEGIANMFKPSDILFGKL